MYNNKIYPESFFKRARDKQPCTANNFVLKKSPEDKAYISENLFGSFESNS